MNNIHGNKHEADHKSSLEEFLSIIDATAYSQISEVTNNIKASSSDATKQSGSYDRMDSDESRLPEFFIEPYLESEEDYADPKRELATSTSKEIPKIPDNITNEFLCILHEQDFELGQESIADRYVQNIFNNYEAAYVKLWLNDMFIQNIENHVIILGILQVLSHLDYKQIGSPAITIAMAASRHENIEIKEYAIRICENWEDEECLTVLKNISFAEKWLDEYRKQVINNLQRELGLHVLHG